MKHFKMLLSHTGLSTMASMEKASFEVTLIGKKQIATRTMEFSFDKPQDFKFNAGQHIRLSLLNPSASPPAEQSEAARDTDSRGNSRFMTLANTPQEKDLIIAMRMTDSAFKRVLGKMQLGEKVLIQILLHSPHGSFVIHEDSSKPAVFLVGGIGIVPAYSMIKDAIERKQQHKIYLFYANRRPEDAPYLEDLQKIANQYPSFELIATMTHPEKSDKPWRGETGYVDQAMIERYLDDLQSPIYYIAGLTDMVNAMKALLKEIGVNGNNVRSEDFSAMKMGLMNMTDKPKRNRNQILYAIIGVMVIAGVLMHAGIAVSLFNTFSIKNISYLTLGFILLLIIFKVFVIYKFKQQQTMHQNNK